MDESMKQYISKSDVVAEIERRIKAYQKNFDKADNKIAKLSTDGRIQALKAILSFLDTLEVKEMQEEHYAMSDTGSYTTTTKAQKGK